MPRHLAGAAAAGWRHVVVHGLTGVFGSYLGRWFLYEAIRISGPSLASLIKNSSPVFVVVLSALLFREYPRGLGAFAVPLVLCGIWVLGVGGGSGSRSASGRRGLWFAGSAAFAFAVADVIRAASTQNEHNLAMAVLVSVVAAWCGMFLVQKKPLAQHLRSIMSANGHLIAASLFMGAAQISLFVAVTHLFVVYVTAIVATAPLWTALLSFIFDRGDEVLSWRFWTASVSIFAGGMAIILA